MPFAEMCHIRPGGTPKLTSVAAGASAAGAREILMPHEPQNMWNSRMGCPHSVQKRCEPALGLAPTVGFAEASLPDAVLCPPLVLIGVRDMAAAVPAGNTSTKSGSDAS